MLLWLYTKRLDVKSVLVGIEETKRCDGAMMKAAIETGGTACMQRFNLAWYIGNECVQEAGAQLIESVCVRC